uniref:Meckelin n=1 Tax=Cuerna arida TaxID=1464854 RepID=A0A1B6EQU8_9HEMI
MALTFNWPFKKLSVVTPILCLFQINMVFMYSSEIISFTGDIFCNKSEYFCINDFKCTYCDPIKNLKPSANKQSCICNELSRKIRKNKEEQLECISCKIGHIATRDGHYCISCTNSTQEFSNNVTLSTSNTKSSMCVKCSSDEIEVERNLDGSLLPTIQCLRCATGTRPSPDQTVCVPCPINAFNGKSSCSCPSNSHDLLAPGVCASHNELTAWPDDSATFTIEYPLSNQVVQSKLLKENLRRDVYLCKVQRRSSACQSVANMCVLSHYRDGSACSLFRDFKHIPSSGREPYPWLYYGDGDAPTVLNRRKIPTRFSLDPGSELNHLNLTIVRWAVNGTWLGMTSLRGSGLQLCPGEWTSQDAAFRFGSHYHQLCRLLPSQLLSSLRQTELFDLYLQFNSSLYSLPVLNTNYQQGNRFPNKEADVGQWQLMRRFFLVDTVSGKPVSTDKVEVIQFLQSATLRIRTQQGEDQGRIYPPLLILKYGEITAKDLAADKPLDVSFTVDFYMDSRVTYTIDIWLGVLCGLTVVWSALQTWSHAKRSAHLVIDLLTLCQLCLVAAGHLSNVFFLVVGLAAVHSLVYYKGQSVTQVLLPSRALDDYVHTYVIVAFSLKLVEVVNMMWQQMSVDIFLIDWERPRATKDNTQPVSIWRTYFVANEWNEIQSERRTSLSVQLVGTVLLIKVFGLENWAVSDPDINSTITPEMLYRPANFTLQFAVAILVYVLVYVIQWLLLSVVYERYIKNGIQEFVDVCSLANISVFILTLENFGYYIHGRI